MPTLTTATTVSSTHEIKLKPAVKQRLLKELRAYAAVKDQIKALEHAADKHKGVIGKLREETGEQSLKIDGFSVTQVAPVRAVLNKQKLVALGCAMAWIEEATEHLPNKPYEKITCPGSKDDEN